MSLCGEGLTFCKGEKECLPTSELAPDLTLGLVHRPKHGPAHTVDGHLVKPQPIDSTPLLVIE